MAGLSTSFWWRNQVVWRLVYWCVASTARRLLPPASTRRAGGGRAPARHGRASGAAPGRGFGQQGLEFVQRAGAEHGGETRVDGRAQNIARRVQQNHARCPAGEAFRRLRLPTWRSPCRWRADFIGAAMRWLSEGRSFAALADRPPAIGHASAAGPSAQATAGFARAGSPGSGISAMPCTKAEKYMPVPPHRMGIFPAPGLPQAVQGGVPPPGGVGRRGGGRTP